MIGNNGKVDGNTALMHLKTDNGIKIERNYSEQMAMGGGGLRLIHHIKNILTK